MKPVAIVQHDAHDGPSYFGTWLTRQGIGFEVFRMFDGHSLPADWSVHSGLCILGGPMGANDPLAYFPALLALTQSAVAQQVPVIGHCLGGQLLSRALGGTVGASDNVEIGWSAPVAVHSLATEWFGPGPLQLFQWHSDSFSIPPKATALLGGKHCANQAYVLDNLHLGMQFHCEVDTEKVRNWLDLGYGEMQRCAASPGVQAAKAILDSLEQDMAISQRIADHIYTRWVQGLKHSGPKVQRRV